MRGGGEEVGDAVDDVNRNVCGEHAVDLELAGALDDLLRGDERGHVLHGLARVFQLPRLRLVEHGDVAVGEDLLDAALGRLRMGGGRRVPGKDRHGDFLPGQIGRDVLCANGGREARDRRGDAEKPPDPPR